MVANALTVFLQGNMSGMHEKIDAEVRVCNCDVHRVLQEYVEKVESSFSTWRMLELM